MSTYQAKITALEAKRHARKVTFSERLFRLLHPYTCAEVAAGAKLLDARIPHWPHSIKIDELTVSDAGCCALKQVYGSYKKGCEDLGFVSGAGYGFCCSRSQDSAYRSAWAYEVQKRI